MRHIFFGDKYYQPSPGMFCKKSVLQNFANIKGQCLRQSLFFNKAADLRPAASLIKILTQVFSFEFCKMSKNTSSFLIMVEGLYSYVKISPLSPQR